MSSVSPSAIVYNAEKESSRPRTSPSSPTCSVDDLAAHLDKFSADLRDRADQHRRGDWSFRSTVLSISSPLWSLLMWGLSSKRRKVSCNSLGRENGIQASDLYAKLWPYTNLPDALPPVEVSLFMSLQAADTLLVQRYAAIAEHMAFTKTGIAGPILSGLGVSAYIMGT